MKILLTRNSAGGYGGAELSAHDNAYCFKKLGHEVVFVSNLSRLRKKVAASGITPHTIAWPNRYDGGLRIIHYLLVTPLFWLQCLYYVFRYKPDVVNAHSREDWIAFTLTKWLHKKPVIWRDPADLRHYLESKPRNPFGMYNRWLLMKALKKVDHIYTLNDEERNVILSRSGDNLDKERISIIPSSVLYDFYDREAPAPAVSDKLIIGTTSLLREQKGIQFLVAAFKKLEKKHDNIELWIVGDGPYLKPLERLATGSKNIRFWGFQSDISPYLARFDIYVQPAIFEGWGRNVKEAMYFKKPVIGSNVGGIARQIEDDKTGLLFEPEHTKELTAKLEQLIVDERLRKRLAQAAQKKAEADGDYLDVVRDQVLPIYERIVVQ